MNTLQISIILILSSVICSTGIAYGEQLVPKTLNFVPVQMGKYTATVRQIFGVYDNKIILGNYTLVNYEFSPGQTTATYPLQSPLKQFKSGVSVSDIVCNEGFYLVVKSHDRDPLCLKAGTISKLASRGFFYGTDASNANYTTIIIPPGSENQASHNTYSPNVATVVLGINNTVRWVNQADTADTIVPDMPLTQNGKSFGSDGVIKPGQSYQFTFTEPGTFAYHTEPHPWMKASITVLSPLSMKMTSRTEIMKNDTSCDTPYLQSDSGIAVLYMPTNSIGKVCVRYYNLNNTPTGVGVRIFEANDLTQNAPNITTWASNNTLQGNENTTIDYFIKTGDKAGFYGLSLTCGGMPFAVGYDANSTIIASDFPWTGKVFHCGVITYDYHIVGTEGIGVKYIPNSSNLR